MSLFSESHAARQYAADIRAGFCEIVFWSPSAGGAVQTPQVIYKAPTQEVLSGEVKSIDYSITYPATVLIGLKRGEVVAVKDVQYTVREDPEIRLDGTWREAKLRKGL